MRLVPFSRNAPGPRVTTNQTEPAPSDPSSSNVLLDDHRRNGYFVRTPVQQQPMSAPNHFPSYAGVPHYSSAGRQYFDTSSHYGGDMQVSTDMLSFAGPRKPSGLAVTAPSPDGPVSAHAPAPSWNGMDIGQNRTSTSAYVHSQLTHDTKTVAAMVTPGPGAASLMGEPAGAYGRPPLDGMPGERSSAHSTIDGRPYPSEDNLGGAPELRSSFATGNGTTRSSNETLATNASLATGTTAVGLENSTASTSPQHAAAVGPYEAGSDEVSSRGRKGSCQSPAGPLTVGDIVTRTIHERRKRPIPKDPAKLTQLDAPIPPRRKMFKAPPPGKNSKDDAANERGGIQFQRGSKRKYKPDETVDELEAQRIRNTLAARRHRLHKAEQWRDMQAQLDFFRIRNQELEAAQNGIDLQHLRDENARLRQKANALEYECHMYRARLQAAQTEHARFPMDPRRQMPY